MPAPLRVLIQLLNRRLREPAGFLVCVSRWQAGLFGLARLLVGRSVSWQYGRDRVSYFETEPR
jgi:hypothetical protein